MVLLDKLKELGVERHLLPENVNEFFGMFGSERQSVIKACDFVRHSPLIGPKIPVHGLLVDIETGKLEWVVNGYDAWPAQAAPVKNILATSARNLMAELGAGPMAAFHFGEMKFPDLKIGEIAAKAGYWVAKKIEPVETEPAPSPLPAAPMVPPKISKAPMPSPVRPRADFRRR